MIKNKEIELNNYIKTSLNIEDYAYYFNYLTNLIKFYEKNIMLLTITKKCKICDEIKSIEKILNINNK